MKISLALYSKVQVILGNSNKRFSGVTSTMLQVLKIQQPANNIVVMGEFNLPSEAPRMTFMQAARMCRHLPDDGFPRVFHARRNDEMIQALILRYIFRAKLKIVFTSTAQRKKTWITRWLMSRMDGQLTTCSAAARYMPSHADIVVPHGIDSSVYLPLSHQEQSSVSSFEKPFSEYIAIFGRVRAQKGVDILVKAAVELLRDRPGWGVVIVGEVTAEHEDFKKNLIDTISMFNLSNRFLFTGKIPFQQLPAYFQNASIVAALSRNEGFGLTVLEAMSSGVAVVASEAGAWPDIITHKVNGMLCKIDSVGSAKDCLQYLMDNRLVREEMGLKAREKVLADHAIEREAEQLSVFYQKIRHS